MRSDAQRLALVIALLVGGLALFVAGFLIVLGVRSVVAGPGSAPPAAAPNPGHSWSEIGDLPGTMWHSNNDGPGSGLDADMLDGLQSTQIQDADDYVSNAGHASSADTATSATSASYAAAAGDSDTVDGLHANQIQDADDYVSNAGYCTAAGDADTVDGQHASAFAGVSHAHNASDINAGTLSTDRYGAYSDLSAEGYLSNEAGDLAQNNGTLQATLNADLLDGLHSNEIQDADDYVSNAGYCAAAGDADTLDGQHGAYYRDATNINAGTLGAGYYSAQGDLSAEGYLGNEAGDLAQNNSTLQATLNADLLDGLHANEIQDADDYVSTAGYCAAVGDADTLDGQHGAYYRDASNLNAGTLDSGLYSAYSDLSAEGYLGNEGGDLAQNNSTLQATLNADLLDGVHANQIQDADDYVSNAGHATTADSATSASSATYAATAGDADTVDGLHSTQIQDADDYVSTAGYCVAVGDADTLDGQHGAYYRDATNINAGTLAAAYYSAYSDLGAEGYLGNEAGDLAQNNGTLQTTLNADQLDGQEASAFASASHNHDGSYWSLTGNSGTTGSNFLGTTDNQALELRVANLRALRLEPTWPPNVVGGYGNSVTAGAVGATVGGGGGGVGATNRVTDDQGTVAGGYGNQAGDDAGTTTNRRYATVGGGIYNAASGETATVAGGFGNSASAGAATVAGGSSNTASGVTATVGGGFGNTASAEDATAGGGRGNTASGYQASVGGGSSNTATGNQTTVPGGLGNTASNTGATIGGGAYNSASYYATVPGGTYNAASGAYSLAAGRRAKANHQGAFVWADSTDADFASTTADQFLVRASGGVGFNVTSGTLRLEPNATSANVVAGYSGNSVAAGVVGAAICGGGASTATNRVTDDYGTVGGGQNNQAGDNAGTVTDRIYATVGGGYANSARGWVATVGGGWSNTAAASGDTVGGGRSNTASGGYATVTGGYTNTADGYYATVAGGYTNSAAGDYTFAAGRQAKANNQGCFVWGDSTNADVACNNDNRFIARASGGVYLYTSSDLSTGAYLAAGSGSWSSVSDRNLKDDFTPVDGQAVLASLAEIPITTWNYKAQDDSILHMGPTAQDFSAAFGLGESDTGISTVDADGVALAAIQGLYQLSQEQAARIDALEEANANLQHRLDNLEARVSALEGGEPLERGSASVPFSLMPFGPLLLAGLFVVGLLVVRRAAGGRP